MATLQIFQRTVIALILLQITYEIALTPVVYSEIVKMGNEYAMMKETPKSLIFFYRHQFPVLVFVLTMALALAYLLYKLLATIKKWLISIRWIFFIDALFLIINVICPIGSLALWARVVCLLIDLVTVVFLGFLAHELGKGQSNDGSGVKVFVI